jgi:NAD(P)-dependent dehydrogenase (short-subunit alcohol dehydrogenase family)
MTNSRRVALVAGASRGIGLGIAEELGSRGATVYVSGRTRAGESGVDDLPGTVDATAARVTALGGRGVPLICDHTDELQVGELLKRIEREAGHLDVLVNAVWGGYEAYDARLFSDEPWEQPVWRWEKMWRTGPHAAYLTARAAAPLLITGARSAGSLLVFVSAGDRGRFLGDVQYDAAKSGGDRLGLAWAKKLERFAVASVVLHPGLTLTERVQAHATKAELREAHSARYVGRAVVALAEDPERMRHTGRVRQCAELGREYGFTDLDGREPEPFVLPELT